MVGAQLCTAKVISIHALLAESDQGSIDTDAMRNLISIHALLAESDRTPFWLRRSACYFYPRSPCGERHFLVQRFDQGKLISIHALLAESDQASPAKLLRRKEFLSTLLYFVTWSNHVAFLSTLSLRRATFRRTISISSGLYFYPRSPCGERRHGLNAQNLGNIISIHALLAESDAGLAGRRCRCQISIHALLAESDLESLHLK